jgi:hypothetical protein
MKLPIICLGIAVVLTACGKKPASEQWWLSMTAPGKTFIEIVKLEPGEKKAFVLRLTGQQRLGVLVREVEKMKEGGDVVLTQTSSQKFIGTYYSASFLFDMQSGTKFTIENRSSVGSDVAVYSESKE